MRKFSLSFNAYHHFIALHGRDSTRRAFLRRLHLGCCCICYKYARTCLQRPCARDAMTHAITYTRTPQSIMWFICDSLYVTMRCNIAIGVFFLKLDSVVMHTIDELAHLSGMP